MKIRSMTGFGEAEHSTPAGRIRVELRSVNHRYFHVNSRLPSALTRWETEIREWLRQSFARGSVNCTVRVVADDGLAMERRLRVDEARVQMYLALFRELGERFGIAGEPDLALISRFSDVFTVADAEEAVLEIAADDLRAAVILAARQANEMRTEEGRRLAEDLEARLRAIELALARIEQLAPERLLTERDRLRAAVRELASGIAVDEDRLAQEIAYLAERWDVNEELVRFRSHIEMFRSLMAAEDAEPVGKRLSFLVQEMHREANTTGSKANDARIAREVVAVKDEIERLREQVENVE
jgi:uncharacterized protein (TIGR00255 family)